MPGAEVDAEVEDVACLLVDHGFGKAKLGNLRADHAAGEAIGIERGHVVTEGREIARHRERRRSRAHASDSLAVALGGFRWEAVANVFLEVGRDALQPADGDRLGLLALILLDPPAAAPGLAGAIPPAPQDPPEHP